LGLFILVSPFCLCQWPWIQPINFVHSNPTTENEIGKAFVKAMAQLFTRPISPPYRFLKSYGQELGSAVAPMVTP